MAYKDLKKLNEKEYARLKVLVEQGQAKAEELFGKNEIADLIGATGMTDPQTDAANYLNEYRTSEFYTPALDYASGVIDGSNPYVQNAGGLAQGYTDFLNSQGTGQPGLTQPLSFAQDRTKDILGTQGQAGLNELVDAQRTAGDVISTGGFTPELNKMASAGYSLLNSGGFSPELMSFIQGMSSMLGGYNGPTPEAKQAFDAAMAIVNSGGEGGSLIPMDQMIAFARQAANDANKYAAERSIRDFVTRGGSFGAGVQTGGPLAEFADQAAQNEAKALRDASLGAQDLRLRREMGGLSAAGQLGSAIEGSAAQQNSARTSALGSLGAAGISYAGNAMRTGADLIGNSNSIASNMFGTAMSGMTSIGNIFANREQNAFGNLLGINNAANQNLALGSDLNRSMYTSGLDASSILGNLAGARNADEMARISSLFGMNQQGVNNQFQLQGMNADQAQWWGNMLMGNGLQGMNNIYSSTAPGAMARQGTLNRLGDIGLGALQGGIGGLLSGFNPLSIPGISSIPGFGGSTTTSGGFNPGSFTMPSWSNINLNG